MLCAVYKSSRKEDTYLYIEKRDDFSKVPDELMATFGAPTFVLMFDFAKRSKLGFADIDRVKMGLTEQGYYLQLPPPKQSLLQAHKRAQSVSGSEDKE